MSSDLAKPAELGSPRFTVDPWDPAYGVAVDVDELEPTTGEVDVNIEVPAAEWRPLDPSPSAAVQSVLFVDGVRRIDAHVWIDGGDLMVHGGICASFAAGAVLCDGGRGSSM